MAKPSSKLLSKIILFSILACLVLASFNLHFIFRKEFLSAKSLLEQKVGEILGGKDVKIGKLILIPYGELILHDVEIRENDILYGRIKKGSIRFKLLPIFTHKKLIITEVVLKEPVVTLFSKDIKIAPSKNKELGKYTAEIDKYFLFKIKSGKFIVSERVSTGDEIRCDMWVRFIDGKGINSKGVIDLEKYCLKDYFLNDIFFFEFVDKIGYQMKASINDKDLSIEKIVFDFDQFKLGATGVIQNYASKPTADLKFSLEDLDIPETVYLKSKLFITTIRNFLVQVKGAFAKSRWLVSMDMFRGRFAFLPSVIGVDNFYCNLRLTANELLIDECSCFLNNFPVGLTCKIVRGVSPKIDFKVVSYPGQVASLRKANPLDFEFSFSGNKDKNSLRGKLIFDMDKKKEKMNITIEELFCKFSDDLRIMKNGNNALPLEIEAGGFSYNGNMRAVDASLFLDKISSKIYPYKGKTNFSDLEIQAYGGIFKGGGSADFKSSFPELLLDYNFDKLDLNNLMKILNLDYELGGHLKGSGRLNSMDFSCLNGEMVIQDGYIKNLALLGLISEFLSVESLKDIYFDEFSSNFAFSAINRQVSLNDMKLRGQDVHLDAELFLSAQEQIKGDVLVRISTAMLRESFKLRLLFFLTGERLPYVDFEFKVGGYLKSPRIKWLDTKFRQNVMKYLPKQGQKTMENAVEKAIKPLMK